MSTRPMRLILNGLTSGGVILSQGTKLLTPDGSDVTGIASIRIDVRPGDIVEATVVLHSVVIEHAAPANAEAAA